MNLTETTRNLTVLVGLTALLAGCESADPTAPGPPTGGRDFVLDEMAFAMTVSPLLTARGCDTIACHGGGIRGTFELSPSDDKNLAFDFLQVERQVDPADPAGSSLLMKPLDPAAGGDVHGADPAITGFLYHR